MSSDFKLYRFLYKIVAPFMPFLFGFNVRGKENIPAGGAMICGNHTSWSDPIFAALAFGVDHPIHFMAKAELFTNKLLNKLLSKLGAFGVERGGNDIGAIKKSLNYLKNGENVFIFPEGTRNPEGKMLTPKTGAIHLADRAGVEIVPVYIPAKKRLFSKITIIIGKPFVINKLSAKLTPTEAEDNAFALMKQIRELDEVSDG